MKYLTHQLIKYVFVNYEEYEDFKCEICGVYLCKIGKKFFPLKNDGTDTIEYESEFLLTCDEFIIKKIIE